MLNESRKLFISILILCIATGLTIGFFTAMYLSSGVSFESKLSADGLLTALVAVVAIIAATYILPINIQPLLQKQKSINSLTHENIRALTAEIESILSDFTEFHISKKVIGDAGRKNLLRKYTRVMNYSSILRKQVDKVAALKDYTEEVHNLLDGSKNDFTENMLPTSKVTERKFLDVKTQLDPVIYKLIEIRYNIT